MTELKLGLASQSQAHDISHEKFHVTNLTNGNESESERERGRGRPTSESLLISQFSPTTNSHPILTT